MTFTPDNIRNAIAFELCGTNRREAGMQVVVDDIETAIVDDEITDAFEIADGALGRFGTREIAQLWAMLPTAWHAAEDEGFASPSTDAGEIMTADLFIVIERAATAGLEFHQNNSEEGVNA